MENKLNSDHNIGIFKTNTYFMSIGATAKDWLLKYKIHHLPFWCLYHYLWWVVAMGNPLKAATSILVFPYAVQFTFYVIFQAFAVYFNLLFLIPKYLDKSEFLAYISFLLLTLISTALVIVSGYYLSAFFSGKSLEELYGKGSDCFSHFFGYSFPSTVASMTFAMSIYLTNKWIQTKRRQQLLELDKLETELKFLKNQFNPHFLFNTINSIFFLIHKKPYEASSSLAKFSDLLRYQLYECNDKQIPLLHELSYLENFIELEKLRHTENLKVTLQMDQHFSKDYGMAPFILMTFVENAFKHVTKYSDKPNVINIRTTIREQQLYFSISNSVSELQSKNVFDQGGIGLKNVKRRLELIYPDKYFLDIQNSNNTYTVNLKINLVGLSPQHIRHQPTPALVY